MLILLLHRSIAPVGPDSDQWEQYIRVAFTSEALSTNLTPSSTRGTLTTNLIPPALRPSQQ